MAPMGAYTERPWPAFSAKPGELTAHGARLLELLGAFFAEQYRDLLADLPCERLALFADPYSPRDGASARAFARGLLSGGGGGGGGGGACARGAGVDGLIINGGMAESRAGRMFRDMYDKVDLQRGCRPPSLDALSSMLSLDHSDLRAEMAQWTRVYGKQLSLMQEVLGCCNASLCSDGGPCTLLDLPVTLNPNITWRAVGGPIGVASAMAEKFVMQYCEGLEAGWGLTEEQVVQLLSLLEVPFFKAGCNDLTSRSLGSELLARLADELAAGADSAAPGLSIYFGHDTNIEFLRRMLGLSWLSDGWWPNLAEPGAQLIFELHGGNASSSSAHSVRILKLAATPGQQRRAERLSLSNPPSVTPVWLPGCEAEFCSLARFRDVVQRALQPRCMDSEP